MPVSSYLLNPLRSLEQVQSELGRDASSMPDPQETDPCDEGGRYEPAAPAERRT
ncbi:hypothetical protein IGS68_18915 [Skermanella sp. TT6]|uniref:Uncharacterized protein n=1 Tax=Skermanella cutis TaxID=2775420 RepID=A0ABX7B1G9_9PROT|nr:hypothetical protein [Skermanella sp. TT6]QQP88116.1 hypothetical protein IGS68_18915 [Skermanella sp. TT6]